MRFACESCKTKYSIEDARVKGKVLKIRCKSCGNVITVREQPGGTPAAVSAVASAKPLQKALSDSLAGVAPGSNGGGGGGLFGEEHTSISPAAAISPSMAALSAPAEADWYVSFDGEQEGPHTLQKAVERARAEIAAGKEAHAWKETFDSWLPMTDIPELWRHLAPPRQLTPAPPLPAVARAQPPVAAANENATMMEMSAPVLPQRAAAAAAVVARGAVQPATSGANALAIAPAPSVAKIEPAPVPAIPGEDKKLPAKTDKLSLEKAAKEKAEKEKAEKEKAAKEKADKEKAEKEKAEKEKADKAAKEKNDAAAAKAEKDKAAKDAAEKEKAAKAAKEAADKDKAEKDKAEKERAAKAAKETAEKEKAEKEKAEKEKAAKKEPSISAALPIGNLTPPAMPVAAAAGADMLNITEASVMFKLPPMGGAPAEPSGVNKLNIGEASVFGKLPEGFTPSAPPVVIIAPGAAAQTSPAWIKWFAVAAGLIAVASLGAVAFLLFGKKGGDATVAKVERDHGMRIDDSPVGVNDSVIHRDPNQAANDPKKAPVPEHVHHHVDHPPVNPAAKGQTPPPGTPPPSGLSQFGNDDPVEKTPTLGRAPVAEETKKAASPEEMAGVVKRNMKQVQMCYERELKRDNSARGRIEVNLRITGAGRVNKVEVVEGNASPEMNTCLSGTIKKWIFPSTGSEYEFGFPLILQAS